MTAYIEHIPEIITCLDSKDTSSVSKGLDNLDSILDQLVSQSAGPSEKGYSSASKIISSTQMEQLMDSQDNFSLNITSRLVSVISWLQSLDKEGLDNDRDQLLIRALESTQALCLIHHKSRECFALRGSMLLILNLLGTQNNAEIQVAAINTLVSSMVHEPGNIRLFEQLDGPKLVCVLFKKKDTPKDVKLKILEFLFFYLIPETQARSPVNGRKSTAMKEKVLAKFLSNAKGLVNELQFSKPFGDIAVEW